MTIIELLIVMTFVVGFTILGIFGNLILWGLKLAMIILNFVLKGIAILLALGLIGLIFYIITH